MFTHCRTNQVRPEGTRAQDEFRVLSAALPISPRSFMTQSRHNLLPTFIIFFRGGTLLLLLLVLLLLSINNCVPLVFSCLTGALKCSKSYKLWAYIKLCDSTNKKGTCLAVFSLEGRQRRRICTVSTIPSNISPSYAVPTLFDITSPFPVPNNHKQPLALLCLGGEAEKEGAYFEHFTSKY